MREDFKNPVCIRAGHWKYKGFVIQRGTKIGYYAEKWTITNDPRWCRINFSRLGDAIQTIKSEYKDLFIEAVKIERGIQ